MNHLGPTDLQHLWSITSKKHWCLLPFQPLSHRAGGNLLQGASSTSSWVLQLLFSSPGAPFLPSKDPGPCQCLCWEQTGSQSGVWAPLCTEAALQQCQQPPPLRRRSIPTESFHHEATKTPQVSLRGSPRPKGRLTETSVSPSAYCKIKSDPTDSRARRSPPGVSENRYPQPSPGSKPLERAWH